jgi:hypothetical protein
MKKNQFTQNKFFLSISIIVTSLAIIMSSRFILMGDIFFHSDIARDFLVVEEMLTSGKPTLLGPKSGGIPGVFHGPLWFYIMLPIMLIGNFNPAAVGWSWIFLNLLSLFSLYWVSNKLFNSTIALAAASFLALSSTYYTHTLFNPFGAVILSPWFLYFLLQYFRFFSFRYLASSILIVGFIFQFQMAFGGPILMLIAPLTFYFCYKNKVLWHLSAYFLLLIPLSTFILFDVRHDFLQTRAVIDYLQKPYLDDFSIYHHLAKRLMQAVTENLNIFDHSSNILRMVSFVIFFLLSAKTLTVKKNSNRDFFLLFIYLIVGYWIVTLLFRGEIWGFYWWPIKPLYFLFITAGLIHYYTKYSQIIIVGLLMIGSVLVFSRLPSDLTLIGSDSVSWQFYNNLAKDVFTDTESDFGYYIFTPDQYGYSAKYALNYNARSHTSIVGFPYKKKGITYLIIAPAPADKSYLNGISWKKDQVRILKKPFKTMVYPNGYTVEKYLLNLEEQSIPSDPNLISGLHFR